jgi:hypothetical protein
MIVKRPCKTCGVDVRRKYARNRVPATVFCSDACRYANPAITFGGDRLLCSIDAPREVLCSGLGSYPIGVGHGYSGYASGCRCPICCEANRVYCLGYRHRRYQERGDDKVAPRGEHGHTATYGSGGCRCPLCVAHHSDAMKAYREAVAR